ncbi:DUF2169 domain-containing protein [Caballeronia sp. TF1N1]|uniref:DUF2169 family type VI secretion system accessory protein n=1 Tax=Caballeronia sp. TF1N1 TaxID=2878153 RepID=UPI001FD1F7B6|nr:DUF2169 domain-containing protein [Caballeronia sp. TF1N1]
MWSLTNETPFAAERCWVRDRNGAEVWIVAVKGTFGIAPDGTVAPLDKQEPMCLEPAYRGEPGVSSLLYDSDLYPAKKNTDIVVNGQAFAPRGRPTQFVDVTVRVANVDKTLRVFGNRMWAPGIVGLRLTDPVPFVKMPLTYERAFGGRDRAPDGTPLTMWDERNPVGVGFASRRAHQSGRPAPNVEWPDRLIHSWDSRPQPAGFGMIASHWKPRVALAGTYDEAWARERQPLLPTDFDDAFYQCVPPDQQTRGFLTGGEPVEVVNMTNSGTLRFALPRLSLGFMTYFEDRSRELHRANLSTVIIEPERRRVLVMWQTQLPCHHKVLKLKTTRVLVKARASAARRTS